MEDKSTELKTPFTSTEEPSGEPGTAGGTDQQSKCYLPPSSAPLSKNTSRPKHQGIWTEELAEKAKNFWLLDFLSASQISARLGVTRNAVIGKLHRLGLKSPDAKRAMREGARIAKRAHDKRRKANRASQAFKINNRPRSSSRAPVESERFVHPNHAARAHLYSLNIPLTETRDRQCRYINGTGKCCGHLTAANSSWCPTHHARVYLPGSRARGLGGLTWLK